MARAHPLSEQALHTCLRSLLTDAHGSAGYKRELLRVYLGRAVRQAADGAGADRP